MCGIIGYIGTKPAAKNIIDGLKKLEYRGYDSAGIAIINIPNEPIKLFKNVGHIAELKKKLPQDIIGNCGIGHTRWATHGGITEENTHPHTTASARFTVAHNGIFDRYLEIRMALETQGIIFKGQTDTEVFVNLLEHIYDEICHNKIAQYQIAYTNFSTEEKTTIYIEAVRNALTQIGGDYAVAIMFNELNLIIAARTASPLVLGVGTQENFIASDPLAIINTINNFIYLKEGDIAAISYNTINIMNINGEKVDRPIETITHIESEFDTDKGSYPHYMLKEIYEQPEVLSRLISRNITKEHFFIYPGLKKPAHSIKFIKLLACGTAYNAALYGKYVLEKLAKIPTTAEIASEFRYREPILPDGTLVIVVSQSGETADTIEALRFAKQKGAYSLGVVNVSCSTISREADENFYLCLGKEVGVASTKAFTGMLIALSIFSIWLGKTNGNLNEASISLLISGMEKLPSLCREVLQTRQEVKLIAERYLSKPCFNFLGRGLQYPNALEGALKFKELSYKHAQGYPAGELKHGPLALIDENTPSIIISTNHANYKKVLSNIQEVLARKGPVIVMATNGNTTIADNYHNAENDDILYIPDIHEIFEPVLTAIPLQLLAYETAVALGNNVDRPRNLAKSVTVE